MVSGLIGRELGDGKAERSTCRHQGTDAANVGDAAQQIKASPLG